MSALLRRLAVVIPARNEELLLPRCLDSIQHAVERLAEQRPELRTRVIVVLDRTTDRSLRVARGRPGVVVVRSQAGKVGRARDLGVYAALRWATGPQRGTWIANTDADSTVPPDWLCTQVRLAETCLDVVVGTVQPDPADLPDGVLAAWSAAHVLGEGHRHIHGANLGFRADVHTRLGGFGGLKLHEDRDFVLAAAAAGLPLLATDQIRVTTSGRLHSRVRNGFADFLAAQSLDYEQRTG